MKNLLPLVGAILAILVGILRGIGGVYLLTENPSAVDKGVGAVLVLIACWLIVSGVCLLVTRSDKWRKLLAMGMIAFWIDGIVNGFLLFGRPLLSGQLINLVWTILVLLCVTSSGWYGDKKCENYGKES